MMATTPQGLSFISAPADTNEARNLDLEGLGKFYKSIVNIFPFTVVDCGSSIDASAIKTFEYATAIFVITSQDVIVVNQTKKVLAKIQENLFPADMVQVVINRFNPNAIVNAQVVQKNVNRPIFAAVPDDEGTCSGALARSQPFVTAAPQAPITRAMLDIVRKLNQGGVLTQLANLKKPQGQAAKAAAAATAAGGAHAAGGASGGGGAIPTNVDPWTAMQLRIHQGLLETLDLKKQSVDTSDEKQRGLLREKTKKAILDLLQGEDAGAIIKTREDSARIVKEVIDEALGLGPLEDLLADDAVSEIMVNARDQIYIEKGGKPGLSPVLFTSEQQMYNVIERIVTPLGRRCDEKSPYVDARLKDGRSDERRVGKEC
jgi:septum site-determining protein MinD